MRKKILAVVAAAMLVVTAHPAAAVPPPKMPIWSGWVGSPSGTAPFRGISAKWVQPAATCNKPNSRGVHDEYASWIGLGQGDNNINDWLVQIGVITDCGGIGEANTPTYEIFWEAVDGSVDTSAVMPPQHTSDYVHAGDQISAKVTTDAKGVWWVSIDVNGTNREQVQFTPSPAQKAQSHAMLESYFAEVISESRQFLQQWPNFGSVTFTDIQVNFDPNQPWVGFGTLTGPLPTEALTLSGKPATSTGPINTAANSFTTTYLKP
ncbi:G1 family glutamic endopeptidase [Kutzneria sp. NPDC052558]|uniref:G1 family glutamic endopeptidase n=1 Tax=Kutzneria sp. NPDC052558 TaxID=3364121 RepID=UPI0037C6507B